MVEHAPEFSWGELRYGRETGEAAAGFEETEARATSLQIQIAAHQKNAVANGFGLKSAGGESPKQTGIRISLLPRFVHAARLLIGITQHDQLVHVFDGPTAANEFVGKPIEQLRVRGLGAVAAEVAAGQDKSRAKMELPDAIHRDSCRERILCAGDPVGQGQAPIRFRASFAGDNSPVFQHRWGDFLLRLLGVAPF